MTKTTHPSLFCLLVLFLGLCVSNCNKASEPPVVTGVWKIDTAGIDWAASIDYERLSDQGYSDQFYASYNPIRIALRDPQTITLEPDNSFSFIFKNGEIATGTYEQNYTVIYFYLNTPPFTDGVFAYTNGQILDLRLGPLYLRPIMLSVFDLTLEEAEDLLEGDNPIVSYMEASVPFRLTSTTVW